MLQIALCDDDQKTLNDLEKSIAGYAKEHVMHLYIDKFEHAKELRKEIEEGGKYQVYFLDIMMPEINGVELGKAIRKRDKRAVIIYLTSFAEYAFQAFGVFAQRYLLKPMEYREFEEAMDYAMEQISQEQKILNINTADGIRRVLYCNIEYVESAFRTLQVTVAGGEKIISRFLRKSFENDMEELLERKNFIQVHKSFIVNLNYVKIYHRSHMVMQSENIIPISKSKQTEVKRFYLKYVSEEH